MQPRYCAILAFQTLGTSATCAERRGWGWGGFSAKAAGLQRRNQLHCMQHAAARGSSMQQHAAASSSMRHAAPSSGAREGRAPRLDAAVQQALLDLEAQDDVHRVGDLREWEGGDSGVEGALGGRRRRRAAWRARACVSAASLRLPSPAPPAPVTAQQRAHARLVGLDANHGLCPQHVLSGVQRLWPLVGERGEVLFDLGREVGGEGAAQRHHALPQQRLRLVHAPGAAAAAKGGGRGQRSGAAAAVGESAARSAQRAASVRPAKLA